METPPPDRSWALSASSGPAPGRVPAVIAVVVGSAIDFFTLAAPRLRGLHENEYLEDRPCDRRWRRAHANERRWSDRRHRQRDRAAAIGAAGDGGAEEVLSVLHDVVVAASQHAGDVYVDCALLRPVVRDDVRPARLVSVGTHHHEVGWRCTVIDPRRRDTGRRFP